MSETVNQESKTPATDNNDQQTGKMFTQAEVNAIVVDRLNRERERYAGFEELKEKAEKYDASLEAEKSELQKAQERAAELQAKLDAMTTADKLRQMREKISAETGVPMSLLSGTTEEECKAQAQGIIDFAKPGSYPKVKDAGEPTHRATGGTTRDQFADWFNSNMK